MKWVKNLGIIVLGIWLIATGLLPLLRISIPAGETILAVLAIAAGILILLRPTVVPKKLGMILLSAWLIVVGLVSLLDVSFAGSDIVLSLLAIAAGIVILLGR